MIINNNTKWYNRKWELLRINKIIRRTKRFLKLVKTTVLENSLENSSNLSKNLKIRV